MGSWRWNICIFLMKWQNCHWYHFCPMWSSNECVQTSDPMAGGVESVHGCYLSPPESEEQECRLILWGHVVVFIQPWHASMWGRIRRVFMRVLCDTWSRKELIGAGVSEEVIRSGQFFNTWKATTQLVAVAHSLTQKLACTHTLK